MELALSQGSRMSVQKEKQLALLAVHMPYEEAKKVYEELTRLKTARMTAHRAVQRLAVAMEEKPEAVVTEPIKGKGRTRHE